MHKYQIPSLFVIKSVLMKQCCLDMHYGYLFSLKIILNAAW